MKITIFNGSHKAERGNTHVMVETFLQGAQEAGAEVEQILLARKTIKSCKACMACWRKTPGQCLQDDDMNELLPNVLASDMLGFATPVYVDNVTGMMKNFMDRLVPLADPHWELDAYGECRHVTPYQKPNKIIVLSNCGFPEQSHFQVLKLLFRRMARNLHCEVIAEVYRSGGSLLTNTEPAIQPMLERYKSLLRKAGREVVETLTLSQETHIQLEQPLVPMQKDIAEYVKSVNKFWDEKLSTRKTTFQNNKEENL